MKRIKEMAPLQIMIEEVAVLLNLSVRSVRRMVRRGDLTDLRHRDERCGGARIVFDPAEVRAFADGRRPGVEAYRSKHREKFKQRR